MTVTGHCVFRMTGLVRMRWYCLIWKKEQEYWEGVAGWRLKIEEESTPEIAAYRFAGRQEMSACIIQALSRMGSISFSVSINGCGLPIR